MTVIESTATVPFFVGIDLHKDSVVIAVFRGWSHEPHDEVELPNDLVKVRRYFRRLLEQGPVHACYEAGACGYQMQRALSALGVHCDVIAPSWVPKCPGDRRKTDRRDARMLARRYRGGDLKAIHVPTAEQEALRELVRCRETLRREVHRSRQYILKLLQRHGLSGPTKKNWTIAFWAWLRRLEIPGHSGVALANYIALLDVKLSQLAELDARLEEVWKEDEWLRGPVGRLRCLHSIDTLSALVLVTEIVDVRRFDRARRLMDWVGLSVSENSSGAVRRQGRITKAGNSRCRRILIEAAKNYRTPPTRSKVQAQRRHGQDPRVVAHALRAHRRLHKRFRHLSQRKDPNVVSTAIARELAGFVWALMHDDPALLLEQPRR